MSQYIGKTISLISTTDNRYVGLLEGIDSENSTVTLREVRCFGTEGRKNWGPDETLPNPTIYNVVKFNGNDVKDLSILDVKIEDVQPVMPAMWNNQMQQNQNGNAAVPAQPNAATPQQQFPAAMAGYGVYAPSGEANVESLKGKSTKSETENGEDKTNEQKNNGRGISQNTQSNNFERTSRDHRSHLHYNQHHNNSRQQNQRRVEIPKEDFDFQSNNAMFAKNEHNEEEQAEHIANSSNDAAEDDKNESFYDKKSSFFDSISTSAEVDSNMRWQEEKALNLDTFGQASARPRFHRGGRGRGRGNRGGRGRGGYNNNRNNYNNHHNNNNYNNQNRNNYNNKSQFQNNTPSVEF